MFQGHPRLVNAVAALYTKLLSIGHTIDPNKEVLVTDGAYEALFTGIHTVRFNKHTTLMTTLERPSL